MASIRPRAYIDSDGVTTVKALISHPMETGQRKDKTTGQPIPAHYITDFTVEHKGKQVIYGMLGPAVSKNPFIQFRIREGKAGDKLKITWTDNLGKSDSIDVEISS